MAYKKTQYSRQELALKEHPELFDKDKGSGVFAGFERSFALENGEHNLFEPIRIPALRYFVENRISWWKAQEKDDGTKGPTVHMLSSQIACLNHLYAIKDDADVVLSIANGLRPGLSFSKVLPILLDKTPGYIAFEVVSKGKWLNEGKPSRGANCTSVDALIIAEKDDGERWLIPIEWKYTEVYNVNDDKSQGKAGKTRVSHYDKLIDRSDFLKPESIYFESVYFFEPFYQLMRQTLWAEQMIKHRNEEWVKADQFLHVHVIPSENKDLLDMTYKKGKGMEETWRLQLKKDIYQIITPEQLLSPLKGNSKYSDLINYLAIRYW